MILDYLDFFKTKGLPIHTARVEVTFLMSKLFHVPLTARSDIFTSEKNMFFSNVKPIPDSRSSSMQLPTGCRLTTTPDKEIQILCPFYPSGDIKYSSYCTIALHWPNTILSFNDFTVSLDIKLRLQSDRIYGLISLVGQLRTCKGVTIVNTGGDSKIEHAEKCERIILPLSRETCCKSCIHLRSLQERTANIEQVVEGGHFSSVEPVGVAEESCKQDNDKSRDTNIDFASQEELLEQTAVSNSDTQDVFEDTEYYIDYSNVVEIGQINSLEHSGIVEDTCILAGDKSKDTEMDFASHDTLFEHGSVANRETQHVFEDTEYYLGYSNVVEIGQMSSLDHSGTVEDTYILAGDKSKDTEMDFASHDTLFKHGSVANRDTQHVFEDAQDSLGYCNVELDDPEHLNEKGGVDVSITADNNDFSELDGITPTNGLNIPATLENKLSTDVFDKDSQTKWLNQEQKNTDTMSDDFGVSRENSRTDMIEDRNNEKMTESEEGDTNMCNDIDEFETLKPVSNYTKTL